MKTVKIYKLTDVPHATLSGYRDYLLEPFPLEIEDDGGKLYELPEGYNLGTIDAGQPAIFDPDGMRCEIVAHLCGKPQLASASNVMPVLKLAA